LTSLFHSGRGEGISDILGTKPPAHAWQRHCWKAEKPQSTHECMMNVCGDTWPP